MIDYLALALEQEEERKTEENHLPEKTSVSLLSDRQVLSGMVRLAERDGAAPNEKRPTAEPGESRVFQDSGKEPEEQVVGAVVQERNGAAEDMVRRLSEKTIYVSTGDRLSGRETEGAAAASLLNGLRRAEAGIKFVRGQGRQISITLPETEKSSSGWGPEELDRAVERDARRYDGGFALY